jgi:hypothetical protein
VTQSPEPFERRALAWDLLTRPVCAKILVYTNAEWQRLREQDGRFARTPREETIWFHPT